MIMLGFDCVAGRRLLRVLADASGLVRDGCFRSQTQTLALQQVLKRETVGLATARRFRVVEADQSLRSLSKLRLGASEDGDQSLLTGCWCVAGGAGSVSSPSTAQGFRSAVGPTDHR